MTSTAISKVELALTMGQPFLYAAGVLLARFVTWPTIPSAVVRPMLIILILSAVVFLLLSGVARSWKWGAIASSAVILLSLREWLPGALLAALAVWWPLVVLLRHRRGTSPPERTLWHIARASGIFSLVFFLGMGWTAYAAEMNSHPDFAISQPEVAGGGTGGPNIYLILLDGYPRADTLSETFGIDTEDFLDKLRDLEFTIADAARSNYTNTWLTLASALNGEYVQDLLADQQVPTDGDSQIRLLHSLIDRASMLDPLRDRGYTIRTIPSPFVSTALTSADDYIDHGHINDFEVRLATENAWAALFPEQVASLLLQAQARTVKDALQTTVDVAEKPLPGRQFVWTHIHSTHTPFVLNHDLEEQPIAPDCFPTCSLYSAPVEFLNLSAEVYRKGLDQQVLALNDLVIDAVREITDADPDAVLILLSDHGSRYSLDDPDEHLKTFLATRTPGFRSPFPDNESLVNLLGRLYAAYFSTEFDELPYRAWRADWAIPLSLVPLESEGQVGPDE